MESMEPDGLSRRNKDLLLLQSCLRYSDPQSLSAVRQVILSARPSLVSQLRPTMGALKFVERASQRSDTCSLAWLAIRRCSLGHGLAANVAMAVNDLLQTLGPLESLASSGDAEACFLIGAILDGREAVLRSARADAGAQARLPERLQTRGRSKRGLQRDDQAEAQAWFERGAAAGSAECALRLSIVYWSLRSQDRGNGRGGASVPTRRSYQSRSARLLARAAQFGVPAALLMTAEALAREEGGANDALAPLRDAAVRLGDPAALIALSDRARAGGRPMEAVSLCLEVVRVILGDAPGASTRRSEPPWGECQCGQVCDCCAGLALFTPGRLACERLAAAALESRTQPNSTSSSDGPTDQASLSRIAALWTARAQGAHVGQGSGAPGNAEHPTKRPRHCEALASTSDPFSDPPGDSIRDSIPAPTASSSTEGPTPRLPMTPAAAAALHGRNAKSPLSDVARSGGYVNLVKGDMRAVDIPGAFVAVREGGRAGATRLGLSHNLSLGPDGATAVAIEMMKETEANDDPTDVDATIQMIPSSSPVVGAWLVELFLNECSCGSAGAKALAGVLSRCTVLDKLGLNYNDIGDSGASAVLNALSSTRISVLGFIGNRIGDIGALAAANSIQSPQCPLRRLYLNENRITDDGVFPLASAVAVNSDRVKVIQDGSVAGSSGGTVPPFLDRLGLSDNAIGPGGGEALIVMLTRPGGTALEKLCASDNPFGGEVHARLATLPNAFVGPRPRSARPLDSAACRVLTIWTPPVPR